MTTITTSTVLDCATVTTIVDVVCCDPTPPADTVFGVIHFGAPRSTTAEERAVRTPGSPTHGRASIIMDLLADKELPILGFTYTDEAGNAVEAPADATETFTSTDESVITIVTADDGQLVARATGTLGSATVHGESTWTDADGASHTVTGDADINVVAGLAERAVINFGEAREVTPDVV